MDIRVVKEKACQLAWQLESITGDFEQFKKRVRELTPKAIEKAEDRKLFKEAMEKIGLECAKSGIAYNMQEALEVQQTVGFPTIIRPSFTLGGSGGGIAYNRQYFSWTTAFIIT